MKKAVSTCKLEGLQTDVYHTHTDHLLPINRLLNTLTYSIGCIQVLSVAREIKLSYVGYSHVHYFAQKCTQHPLDIL